MNEYLNKLRKLLEKNHYEDVDNTMEYYEELFADKREAGESDVVFVNIKVMLSLKKF